MASAANVLAAREPPTSGGLSHALYVIAPCARGGCDVELSSVETNTPKIQ